MPTSKIEIVSDKSDKKGFLFPRNLTVHFEKIQQILMYKPNKQLACSGGSSFVLLASFVGGIPPHPPRAKQPAKSEMLVFYILLAPFRNVTNSSFF